MTETELAERLERLERAHRRFKGFALAALVLATALATIYATQPVPQKITAHEFDALDNSGSVRVSMGMRSGRPSVWLRDAQGKIRVMVMISPDDAGIDVMDAQEEPRAALTVNPDGKSYIGLLGPGSGESGVYMTTAASGSPQIRLTDPQGFEIVLGSTRTATPTTGETHQYSAASIVMSGKDHVIWRAP
ncbi:MAG: hypothetical protein ABSE93_08565 [Terriglobia bacterium]|jgi:hypothetical protein